MVSMLNPNKQQLPQTYSLKSKAVTDQGADQMASGSSYAAFVHITVVMFVQH